MLSLLQLCDRVTLGFALQIEGRPTMCSYLSLSGEWGYISRALLPKPLFLFLTSIPDPLPLTPRIHCFFFAHATPDISQHPKFCQISPKMYWKHTESGETPEFVSRAHDFRVWFEKITHTVVSVAQIVVERSKPYACNLRNVHECSSSWIGAWASEEYLILLRLHSACDLAKHACRCAQKTLWEGVAKRI